MQVTMTRVWRVALVMVMATAVVTTEVTELGVNPNLDDVTSGKGMEEWLPEIWIYDFDQQQDNTMTSEQSNTEEGNEENLMEFKQGLQSTQQNLDKAECGSQGREASARERDLQQQLTRLQEQLNNAIKDNNEQLQDTSSSKDADKPMDCQEKVLEMGMVELGNKYYYFSEDANSKRRDWLGARQFCRSHGLQLASIQTDQENRLVIRRATQIQEGPRTNFWVGGSYHGNEGRWVWSDTGLEVGFSAWHEGQPDTTRTGGNCMKISTSGDPDFGWWSSPCAHLHRFVCEMTRENCA